MWLGSGKGTLLSSSLATTDILAFYTSSSERLCPPQRHLGSIEQARALLSLTYRVANTFTPLHSDPQGHMQEAVLLKGLPRSSAHEFLGAKKKQWVGFTQQ